MCFVDTKSSGTKQDSQQNDDLKQIIIEANDLNTVHLINKKTLRKQKPSSLLKKLLFKNNTLNKYLI